MKRALNSRAVTQAQLAERLAAMGIHETERNLTNKIGRGGISAAFLLQCLTVVGASSLPLHFWRSLLPREHEITTRLRSAPMQPKPARAKRRRQLHQRIALPMLGSPTRPTAIAPRAATMPAFALKAALLSRPSSLLLSPTGVSGLHFGALLPSC
ncbi:DUF6471 domain-containing protein [Brevundimonas sp.]|uniref:DUF6471 domain-containing protein n=1 Tax=Brevundimonas sp. TaxID=1871086 RepID=UPI00344B5CD0